MYDLIVIGGGPAGTSAAITANRDGANVLILERGHFPRNKVCGEFVSAESLGVLESLLSPEHKQLLGKSVRISKTRVFLDGSTIETAIRPPAASIARLDLDAALWDSARSLGVDSRQRITVQSVSGSGPFHVTTFAGPFESRALIDASGRWANLNVNGPQNNGSRKKWLGLKGHFSERKESLSVDLYFFTGGYCGVQPVELRDSSVNGGGDTESRVNACAMVRADVASTIQDVFRQHPELDERSRGWKALTDAVTTSPLLFRRPAPERDGILVVGDAALFVDPFVGDGISLALKSGVLAGKSLVPFFRNELSLRDAARSYRQLHQHRLVPVFRVSSILRHTLELPRLIRAPMTYMVRNSPALSRYLVDRTRS